MTTQPEITVIIPTRNEGGNIGRLLDTLFTHPRLHDAIEVLVADDGSTDSTHAEVAERATRWPVRLLAREGQPPDLTASVLNAARHARGRWCVVMDADGSHPPEAVEDLVAPLRAGLADVVVGSRHVPQGSMGNWPWVRRMISKAAASIAWPYTDIRDPMSGFFATSTERLASLDPIVAGYKVLLEVLVRTRPEPRVIEVPIRFNDRGHGTSKMNLRVQWLFLRRLAALGGARLDLSNLSRFSLVGLSGVIVDLGMFWLLRGFGTPLAAAHMTAFLIATLSNFALNSRFSFRHPVAAGSSMLLRYFAFLVVALLALAVRGGVLVQLTRGLGIDASLAILPAVAITAVINYLGSIFYVFPDRQAEQNPAIRWSLAALALIALSLALRALYLGHADLMFDEMYYWVYAQHQQWSYLDHPPLTAWLIAAGTWLFGDTAFGVRAANLLLAPASMLLAYRYTRHVTGDKTHSVIAAMLIGVVPAWAATGFLMTTDAALVTAWLAALVFLYRALVDAHERAWWGAGIAIGLGALAKYTILFLVPGILIMMLWHRPSRRALRSLHAWGAGLLSLLLFSPVLIWNAQHDWASFAFQSTRRISEDPQFSLHMLPVQLVVALAPLAGVVVLWLLLTRLRHLDLPTVKRQFMLAMSTAPLGVLALFAVFTETKFHWVVPVGLALLPALAMSIDPRTRRLDRFLRALRPVWQPVLPLSLALIGMGLHYVSLGLPGIPWQPNRMGYMGWPELAREVYRLEREIEEQTGKRPIVAGMAKWGIAAALSFHDVDGRRDNITARNLVGLSGSQWELWFDPETDPHRPVLLVSHEPKLIDREWLERALIGLGPLHTRTVYRNGKPIQVLYYRIGQGFRPEMLRYPGHVPE